MRHLIDGGALMRGDSGRWQLNVGSPRITIPDTIRGVIMARIDLLPETARRHLRQASVIGRKFPFRILADLAGTTHPQLHESLALLEKLQLVQRCRTGRELEFVFKHDLVHETTYEGVLLRTRKELHGRVARALEEHYSELLEESTDLWPTTIPERRTGSAPKTTC